MKLETPIQTSAARPSKRYGFQELVLDLHLWLGLISGLIVFVLCLSGTLLVLQDPLERHFNQQVLRVQPTPGSSPMPLEQLVPQLAAGQDFSGILIPHDPQQAIQLQKGRAPGVYVNPYSGEILGELNPQLRASFMVFFRLHRWLLLDSEIGRPVTGAATLMFVVILLSGLILWVFKARPRPSRALMFKRGVSWKRLNYDLHVILGFYSFAPLLIMALTALFWSYNGPFESSVYYLFDGKAPAAEAAPAETGKGKESGPAQKPRPVFDLPYTRLQAEALRLYPYAGDLQIRFPTGHQPVMISKTHNPSPWSVPYRDGFSADSQSGKVLEITPFANKSRAEKMLSLVKSLHVGTILGCVSFWVYLSACLIATSLPLTGVIHWALKLKARRRSRKPGQPPVEVTLTDQDYLSV